MPAPRERDFEQTRARLERWLAGRLAGARDVSLGELSGPGTTGFSSDTFLADATWRDARGDHGRGLVFRLKPSESWIFPEYDIVRQYRIQERLGPTAVPTAPMLWLEEDAGVVGSPFYVMERVDGRIPTDNPPYHTGGWLTEVAPAEREALWWSGLDALVEIHRLDWRAVGLGFLDEPGLGLVERQLAYYRGFLRWAGGPAQAWLEGALARLEARRPPEEGPSVLSWGDSRIGNMIFREGRCVAVLDWEMAGISTPELDLGWWIFMDHHHSAGVGAPRLPGFPDRDATIARYAERTGYRLRDVAWYEAFAAFRFSAIMVRIGQQLKHFGLLPADSRFELENSASHLLSARLELPLPAA